MSAPRPRLPRQTVLRPAANNSILRIRSAHARPFNENELMQNAFGVVKGTLQTTNAQAPSLYHWLFQRCGIGFAESDGLVAARKLLMGKRQQPLVDAAQLRTQLPYERFPDLQLRVVKADGVAVDALDRRAHRSYRWLNKVPSMLATNVEAEPRSFVHRMPTAVFGAKPNLLQLPGSRRAVRLRGLALVTTDLTAVPLWESGDAGTWGVLRIQLDPALSPALRSRFCAKLRDECGRMRRVPALVDGSEGEGAQDLTAAREMWRTDEDAPPNVLEASSPSAAIESTCTPGVVWMATPFFSKALMRMCRRGIAVDRVECVGLSGAFQLPLENPNEDAELTAWLASLGVGRGLAGVADADGTRSTTTAAESDARLLALPPINIGPLAPREHRPLTDGELDRLFALERRLKAHRIVASLREAADASDSDLGESFE